LQKELSLETTTTGFAGLGLSPALCEATVRAGYTEPTPIQREAIPHVAQGSDVLGCAQTGTGKTAAFALPIIQRLLEDPDPRPQRVIRALVLAPTRELAAQIGETFGAFQAGTGLRHHVVFGGVGKVPQIEALRRGIDVLVATPGRLIDLMNDGVVNLRCVQVFVLDEADRMLDMGFIHDVRRVITKIPPKRQTLLFSATMPREIEELANRILMKPVRIAVDPPSSVGLPISQSVYFVDVPTKMPLLATLLQADDIDRVLVFTRTKHGANRVAEGLIRAGFSASAIHGNKSQNARERTLSGFKNGEIRVVVATDIAARGIDIKDLSHVINYDVPEDPESYVHRIGRTGRAGRSGVALSFCSPQERPDLHTIEKLTRLRIAALEVPKQLASIPSGPRNPTSQQSTQSRGGGGGSRGGGGGGPRGGGGSRGGGGGGSRGGGGRSSNRPRSGAYT
jgi:ATP-dependent RNA helicase RhlE